MTTTDNMSVALERLQDPYALTFDQQVEALEFVNELVGGCYGHGKRWMHRAYLLGGEILGLPFGVARQAFEDCSRMPVRAVASNLHGMIRIGTAIGKVYFAKDRFASHYKIGWSATPIRRVEQVSREAFRPMLLLGTMNGFKLHEHNLHSRFMSDRIASEWFSADSTAIPAFMENCTQFKRLQIKKLGAV